MLGVSGMSMDEVDRRPDDPEPGYYAIDAGVLNVRELARIRGLLRLPLTLLARGLVRPAGRIWMPRSLREIGCRPDELSPRFQELTATHRADLAALDFEVCHAARTPTEDEPELLDNGTLTYLDASRRHMATITFAQRKASIGAPIDEWLVLSFVARLDGEVLVATDKREGFDPPPGTHRMVVRGASVPELHRRFAAALELAPVQPRPFVDTDELLAWENSRTLDAFRRNVARRLYVRLGGREIAKLRVPPQAPVSRRRRVLGWLPTIGAAWVVYRVVAGLTPSTEPAQSTDEFCNRLLQRGLHREARAWLAEDRPADRRIMGPHSAEQSRQLIEEIYRRGAVDVQAVQILVQPGRGQLAVSLVVRLPGDPVQRRALLALETTARDGGLPDEGQHLMLLHPFAGAPPPPTADR